MTSVCFSADGQRLASATQDGTVKVWDAGTVKLPDPKTANLLALAWHRREARDNVMARQWFAAIFHLTPLIDAQPNAGDLRVRRAYAYAELGQEDKAARDFAKSLESAPSNLEPWLQFAHQRLDRRDLVGYRKVCVHLLDHFGMTRDPNTANGVAWACVLVPDAIADPLHLLRLIEVAVSSEPKSYYYLNTLGAALYRAGKFEEAIMRLNEAIQVQRQGDTYADWLFLAMAHHRLGHGDEAKQWLAKAGKDVPLLEQQLQEMQLLRHEAEALLKHEKPVPKPRDPPGREKS
jgi:tetratricopeptide (TPR) repeat protein